MTIKEVREYALANYNKGGDVIVECWEDAEIQEELDFGKVTKEAWDMLFKTYYYNRLDVEKFADGYEEEPDEWEEVNGADAPPEYEMDENDYSPSNPWDAPGMGIRDFI